MSKHRWTQEQLDWLRKHYPAMTPTQMVPKINKIFGCNVSASQVRSTLRNHKITQGQRDGRFKPGNLAWNKGVKGYMGANRTSFKPGHKPRNTRELWSERVSSGYVEISIPEPNPYTGAPTRFVQKHVWIWEQAHGKRPKGCAIIFKDGDRNNFALDNLVLVTRAELLVLNLHRYKNQPSELKPSLMLLAKMEAKAGCRPRRKPKTVKGLAVEGWQ